MDSLIYLLGCEKQQENHIREMAFKVMLNLIEGQPRSRILNFSKKITETMLLRDKILAQILEIYVPNNSEQFGTV